MYASSSPCLLDTCEEPAVEHGEVEGRSSGRGSWTGTVSCAPGYTRLGPGYLKCRDGG